MDVRGMRNGEMEKELKEMLKTYLHENDIWAFKVFLSQW